MEPHDAQYHPQVGDEVRLLGYQRTSESGVPSRPRLAGVPLLSEIRQEVVGVIGRQVIHVDCRAQTEVLTAVIFAAWRFAPRFRS